VTYNSGTDYTFRERFIVPAERGYFEINWFFPKDRSDADTCALLVSAEVPSNTMSSGPGLTSWKVPPGMPALQPPPYGMIGRVEERSSRQGRSLAG